MPLLIKVSLSSPAQHQLEPIVESFVKAAVPFYDMRLQNESQISLETRKLLEARMNGIKQQNAVFIKLCKQSSKPLEAPYTL